MATPALSRRLPDLPTPLEMDCLKALWLLGEASVRTVQQALRPTRPLAYTTVMTVLERLTKKGGLSRRKCGRLFLYTPLLTRDELRRLAVRQVIDGHFEGSPERLAQYLHPITSPPQP